MSIRPDILVIDFKIGYPYNFYSFIKKCLSGFTFHVKRPTTSAKSNKMRSTTETLLTNLQKLLSLLDPNLNSTEMLNHVIAQVIEMFEVSYASLIRFEADQDSGLIIAEYPSRNSVGRTIPLKNYPLIQELISTQKPISVLDAQNDPIMGVVRRAMQTLEVKSLLMIPLIVRGKLIGGLSLEMIRTERQFTSKEIEMTALIANQIAVTIDYTDVHETIEQSHQESEILQQVNQRLGETLDLNEVLPLILEQLEQVLSVDGSSIYLLLDENVQLKARRGGYSPFLDQQIIPVNKLWGVSQVVQTKEALLINDTENHPNWEKYSGSPIRAWLGIPLVANGEVVGVLNIDGYSVNRFDEQLLPLALAFANQSAMAIYNARLYGQAKTRAELLASVQEIGVRLVSSFNLEDILQIVITSVIKLLDAGQARIYLYDDIEDSFTLAAILDNAGKFKMHIPQPRHDGLTYEVARSGEYMMIPDILFHPLYRNESGVHGFRAIASMPLKKRDKVLGVLNVFYAEFHHFAPEEVDALELLAVQIAVALENARLYSIEQERLEDQARRVKQWQQVQAISSTLNSSLNLDYILNTACERFTELINIDHCGVMLIEADGIGRLVAEHPSRGAIGLELPIDYPAFQAIMTDHQPYISANVGKDEQLGAAQPILERVGIQSLLLVPLVVQDQVIGSIGFDAIQAPRQFTEEEINIIRVVTDQMAIAVTNARTYEAEHEARLQANTLREVAEILGATLDLREVLSRILTQLKRLVTCDSASIILRETTHFPMVATKGLPEGVQIEGLTFALTQKPYFQEIARSKQPLVISDTAEFAGWDVETTKDIGSWVGVPLVVSDQLIGILTLEHQQPNFYHEDQGEVIKAFADLATVALENARLYEFEVKQVEQELELARQVQRGFFPDLLPDLPNWQLAAICRPAKETGGDFYTFVERPDETVGIIVGDVSGKSISAAMLMAGAHSVVRSKGSDHRSPAEVLREANRLLYDDVSDGSFVAVSYALISATEPKMWLSSGGQVAPIYVPANGEAVQLIEPPGDRLPLGVLNDVTYQEACVTMKPGDLLIFYTDGLVEEHNAKDELFGFERVLNLVNEMRGQGPDKVMNTLLTAIQTFAGQEDQHDDVTLVVLQNRGTS